ncbi:MAG TPA: glycoside hydrolase domain-containing protein [archaeon]|nr:glycoside hydrolase domain-containing protein [archaeon]
MKRLCSIVGALLLLCGCLSSRAALSNLIVWAANDMVRIDPLTGRAWEESGVYPLSDRLGRGYRLKSAVWDSAASTVSVAGAGNEYVAFQVIIERRGEEPLTGIKLSRLELSGPARLSPGRDVQIYKEWYIQVRRPSRNYAFPLGLGWYPDVLIPLESLSKSTLGAELSVPDPGNGVPGQRAQSFWVEIYIPKSQPAGEYRGELEVSTAQGEKRTLEVRLTVWDFTLPDELHFAPSLNSYGTPSGTDEKTRIQLYQIARRMRCVPDEFMLKPPVSGQGSQLRLDWTEYDKLYAPMLDGSLYTVRYGYRGPGEGLPLKRVYLPFTSASWPVGKKGKGEKWFEESYHKALRLIEEHFEEKGWKDTELVFFINDYDEPTKKEQFEDIRYFGTLLRSAGLKRTGRFKYRIDIGHFADIHTRIPDWNTDTVLARLGDVVDLWVTCGGTPYVNARLMSKLVNVIGRDVWFYTSNTAGEPCIGSQYLDSELLGLRTWAWITWKYKLTTGCIWEWTYGMRDNKESRWLDPWTDFRLAAGNGDACLVYNGRFIGLDEVLPAMRFASLRRGAQDYEYFVLLTGRFKGNTVPADLVVNSVVRAALDETPQEKPGDWSHDPEVWLAARYRLAHWIMGNYNE